MRRGELTGTIYGRIRNIRVQELDTHHLSSIILLHPKERVVSGTCWMIICCIEFCFRYTERERAWLEYESVDLYLRKMMHGRLLSCVNYTWFSIFIFWCMCTVRAINICSLGWQLTLTCDGIRTDRTIHMVNSGNFFNISSTAVTRFMTLE